MLDRYVEMSGWDAVLPVARTDIGNVAMTADGMEPLFQPNAFLGTLPETYREAGDLVRRRLQGG